MPALKAPKLTRKQAAFIREYLIDLNAAEAARRAGYSPKTADRTGHENLKKPEIATAIAEAQAERATRTEVTADRVVEELSKVAFVNLLDCFRLSTDGEPAIALVGSTPDQAAALTEIQVDDYVEGRGDDARDVRRVRIKVAEMLRALETLGQHLGMCTGRDEAKHSFDGVIGIRVNLPKCEDDAP